MQLMIPPFIPLKRPILHRARNDPIIIPLTGIIIRHLIARAMAKPDSLDLRVILSSNRSGRPLRQPINAIQHARQTLKRSGVMHQLVRRNALLHLGVA